MDTFLRYAALFVVITLGVTAGNLLSTGITAWVVASGAEVALKEMQKETATRRLQRIQQENELRQQTARNEAKSLEAIRKSRSSSSMGRELNKQCQNFTNAHRLTPSKYSEEDMKKACERYTNYVEKGNVSGR